MEYREVHYKNIHLHSRHLIRTYKICWIFIVHNFYRCRDPFVSRHIQTFNFLCADACTQMQTHARGQTHTHAKLFSCPPCPSCCLDLESLSPPILVSILVAFQDPEIQLALDQLFPKPHPPTYSAQNKHIPGRPSWFLDNSYWEVMGLRWSLSCVDSLHLQARVCSRVAVWY